MGSSGRIGSIERAPNKANKKFGEKTPSRPERLEGSGHEKVDVEVLSKGQSKNRFSGRPLPPSIFFKIGQFFDEKCNLASSGDGKEAFQGSHYTIKRLWRNLNRQGRLESQNCSRSSFPEFFHFYPVLLGRWSNMLGLV